MFPKSVKRFRVLLKLDSSYLLRTLPPPSVDRRPVAAQRNTELLNRFITASAIAEAVDMEVFGQRCVIR